MRVQVVIPRGLSVDRAKRAAETGTIDFPVNLRHAGRRVFNFPGVSGIRDAVTSSTGTGGWPRAASARRARIPAAYTYVELLVTLGILTAVMGLVLPLVGKTARPPSRSCRSPAPPDGLRLPPVRGGQRPDVARPVQYRRVLGAAPSPVRAEHRSVPAPPTRNCTPPSAPATTGRAPAVPTRRWRASRSTTRNSTPTGARVRGPAGLARPREDQRRVPERTATSTTEEDCLADIQTPLRYPILVPKPSPPQETAVGDTW